MSPQFSWGFQPAQLCQWRRWLLDPYAAPDYVLVSIPQMLPEPHPAGADIWAPCGDEALASEPDGPGFESCCTACQAWKLGQISSPIWISVSLSVNHGDPMPASEDCCENEMREGREVLGL